MKKILILFFLIASSYMVANAQPGKRIQQFKVAFITEHLALSSEDSVKFWPVYNAYEKEKLANRNAQRDVTIGFTAKSDEQLKTDVNKIFSLKEEEVAIDRKYFEKFLAVISIRQIAALFQAENQIKKRLLERFGGRGGGGGGRRR